MKNIASSPNPIPLRLRSKSPEENRRTYMQALERLKHELDPANPVTIAARARLVAMEQQGVATESLRRVGVDEALELL